MSFHRYPSYKNSGVAWLGDVPDHWEIQPLYGSVVERSESNDGMIENNLLSLSYGRIVSKDISSNDGLLPESFETYQVVKPGDIVFRLTDLQNDKRSLRTAIVEETGIITSAYLVVTPRGPHSKYMNYLFRAYDVTKVFYSMGGGLRQSMKFADLKRMPTILPPLAEQIAISAFLDGETRKIDVLVAEQQRLIELLKEKRLAVISRAVTKGLNPDAPMKPSGIAWLGDVPAHWVVASVAHRYDVQLGKMLDSAKITGAHLRPYLRVLDVQWGYIQTADLPEMDFDENARARFRLVAGDLVVNEGGSYPGRSAIWSAPIDECYYQKALHRLRPHDPAKDTTDFFYFVMLWAANQGVFVAGGNETTIEHLPAEKLRAYRLAFPPIQEQRDVALFLIDTIGGFDTLTAEAQRAIDLLRERRSALISAVATGQIDVRGIVDCEAA